MESTRYIVMFVVILTTLVALSLTSLKLFTQPIADKNEAIFNKRAILLAVEDVLADGKKVADLSDEEVLGVFQNDVKQTVIDMKGKVVEGMTADDVDMAKEEKKPEAERYLPLYTYQPAGSDPYYILAVRGSGLWDKIWGNIALQNDVTTVVGATFDHKGETPGLGAEIKDNPTFANNFKGTKIFKEGEFVSVNVRKGGARNNTYEVDGISGATVTADGVDEMLERGIGYYLPYLEALKGGGTQGLLMN